jgi:uncharacterized membrane protein
MNDNVSSTGFKGAKEPLTPLSGPYGHPIHPMLVTVPIGAWASSLIFDAIGMTGDERTYAKGAKHLMDIGLAGAGAAAVFGLMDFLKIPRGTRAWYAGVAHLAMNVSAVGLYAINSSSRGQRLAQKDERPAVTWWQRAMSATTFASLVVSGWLGGSLTYRYGVRVADEEHQRETGYRPEGLAQRLDALFGRN